MKTLKPCSLEDVKAGDVVYTPAGTPRTVKSVSRDAEGRLRMLDVLPTYLLSQKAYVTYLRTDVKGWTTAPPGPAVAAPAAIVVDTVSQTAKG